MKRLRVSLCLGGTLGAHKTLAVTKLPNSQSRSLTDVLPCGVTHANCPGITTEKTLLQWK